jgi:GntR family transcriptional regulator, rspAB operon transcriptional repressor
VPMKTRVTKKTQVYDLIRRAILTNELKPGDILNESELAQRFNSSKTPTREALIVLSHENYLEPMPRVGYIVTKTTIQDIRETFHLRIILEDDAAALAAENITPAELDLLQENYRQEKELSTQPASREGDQRAFQLNREFHLLVAHASRNTRLARTIQQIIDDMERMLALDPYPTDPAQHEVLLDALKTGDAPAARLAMRKHLEEARFRIINRY